MFAALAEHKPVPCFCRSNPRFANIIERPNGRLGLVDWEDSGLPRNERLRRYLARALAWPEMDFRNRLEDFGDLEFFPER